MDQDVDLRHRALWRRGGSVPGDSVACRRRFDSLPQPIAVRPLGFREGHVANQVEGRVVSGADELGELNDEVRTLPGGNLADESDARLSGSVEPWGWQLS
jgi:hypothetical protein